MTTRLLQPSEWATGLVGTELANAVGFLPPDSQVLVVESDGRIVGAWAAIPYWHLEGIYIAPEHRKRGDVALRLLRGMRRVLRAMGVSVALTAATTDDVRGFIDRLGGTQLPGDHYVVPFGGV